MSLPTADDLFRPTAAAEAPAPAGEREDKARPEGDERPVEATPGQDTGAQDERPGSRRAGPRKQERSRTPSGRVRHDEKMTVYVTADELLDLEHARLALRRETGLAVDRGRLVREAVAIALADLDANGEDSLIVRRLKQS